MESVEKVNLSEKLALIRDHWHPRLVGEPGSPQQRRGVAVRPHPSGAQLQRRNRLLMRRDRRSRATRSG